MEILIEKIVLTGRALGRSNGKVIFTDEGIPGEKVEVSVLREKKNYIEGKTTQVIAPSAARCKPRCTHYPVCGSYQYIDYQTQCSIKKRQVEETISHNLKIECPVLFRPSPSEWFYRNKLNLSVLWKTTPPRFAYHHKNQPRSFSEVDECFLASVQINKIIGSLASLLPSFERDAFDEITVRENNTHDEIILLFQGRHPERVSSPQVESLLRSFPVTGILYRDTVQKKTNLLNGRDFLSEKVAGNFYRAPATAFFQINIPAFELLLADLRESLPCRGTEHILDLYCGTGVLGGTLAPSVREVVGIEKERCVIAPNKSMRIKRLDCERIIPLDAFTRADIVIVDPPRRGLTENLCRALVQHRVPRIVYLSCDPATFVRDLAILMPEYRFDRLFAYDFFPQTPHLETMAILSARNTKPSFSGEKKEQGTRKAPMRNGKRIARRDGRSNLSRTRRRK